MCRPSMLVRKFCILIVLWFASIFSLSAQERSNEMGSINNQSGFVENSSAGNKNSNLPRVSLSKKWAKHGILFKVAAVLLSVASGLALLVVFWLIHPFTVAPITSLTNSVLEILLGRFSFAITGGILGFCLPGFCYLVYFAGTTVVQSQALNSDGNIHLTSSNTSQEGGDNASSLSVKNDVRPEAAVLVNKPEIFNWDGGDPKVKKPDSNEGASLASPAPTTMNQGGLSSSNAATVSIKIAEIQGDLAVINSKIETERKRWQDANAAINAVTNNKTTPVVRNSPEHVQMYQAQVIMKQVEAGAPALKEEKGRLEAMLKSLQDSPPATTR